MNFQDEFSFPQTEAFPSVSEEVIRKYIRNKNRRALHSEMPEFLAVDFYCGAGGTTRGLIDAGGYVICGIDK